MERPGDGSAIPLSGDSAVRHFPRRIHFTRSTLNVNSSISALPPRGVAESDVDHFNRIGQRHEGRANRSPTVTRPDHQSGTS